MNTPTIECLMNTVLERYKKNNEKQWFLGVFPADKIPPKSIHKSYPCCFIANTDPSHLPGEHWVAFYFQSPNNCEFFDSYGLDPLVYGFNSTTSCEYSSTAIQSDSSELCGHHCIFYLLKKLSSKRKFSVLSYVQSLRKALSSKSAIDSFVKAKIEKLFAFKCIQCPITSSSYCKFNQCCKAKSCCNE